MVEDIIRPLNAWRPSNKRYANSKFTDVRGTLQRKAEHKEKPATPDISRVYELLSSGADGGTRTHTPLLTTDFESVSSASSDTSAYETFFIIL